MKIIRGGKEYELTFEERLQAYHEQQLIFDCDNISENLSWIMDRLGSDRPNIEADELTDNDDFVKKAAEISRDLQDGEDMNFSDALVEAVRRVLKERK